MRPTRRSSGAAGHGRGAISGRRPAPFRGLGTRAAGHQCSGRHPPLPAGAGCILRGGVLRLGRSAGFPRDLGRRPRSGAAFARDRPRTGPGAGPPRGEASPAASRAEAKRGRGRLGAPPAPASRGSFRGPDPLGCRRRQGGGESAPPSDRDGGRGPGEAAHLPALPFPSGGPAPPGPPPESMPVPRPNFCPKHLVLDKARPSDFRKKPGVPLVRSCRPGGRGARWRWRLGPSAYDELRQAALGPRLHLHGLVRHDDGERPVNQNQKLGPKN